jgi:hypothetical protein
MGTTFIPYQTWGAITEPYYSSTTLLLPMDGSFADYSPLANTITVNGNTQISTAQSKWGGASGLFDGTTDWLYSPVGTGDFDGDFTIEGWFRWSSLTNGGLFHVYPGTPANSLTGLALGYDGSSFQVYAVGASNGRAYTPTVGVWYHIALVRTVSGGSFLTLYVDGVAQGATISDSTVFGGNGVNIGLYYGSGFTFNGYIDDFRVTTDVARYTSDFTPPTGPFPTA